MVIVPGFVNLEYSSLNHWEAEVVLFCPAEYIYLSEICDSHDIPAEGNTYIQCMEHVRFVRVHDTGSSCPYHPYWVLLRKGFSVSTHLVYYAHMVDWRPHYQTMTWTERQRIGDLMWLTANRHRFVPAAVEGYLAFGRGVLAIDAICRTVNGGYRLTYISIDEVILNGSPEEKRYVQHYQPEHEIVVVLFQSHGWRSVYRVLSGRLNVIH